ncbi:acetylglutamate kinase [Salinimicrobium terrae]|uniref:acetylglutamate kinase n=1 Tax=Salinimicrobium terrae TaxID=470866 RepID=UPI0004921785|nr:acetylglutamate kinase [Salinimicrobium terrae]
MKKQNLTIVKIGGKLIENEERLTAFLQDFSALEGPKILIHGGGNMATEIASKLGFPTQMVDGRRITDADSLKVIVMTYGGLINKTIVAKLQAFETNAVGLCGADGKSIISKKRPVKEIDYGFVGDIETVNSDFISSLLEQKIVPVFSAISATRKGQLLNTNGDSVAAEVAKAMSSFYTTELYYCFEKKGVLENPLDEDSVISEIDGVKYRQLLENKIISEGMLPKLHNCFEALKHGVNEIYLGDAHILKAGSSCTKIIK